MEALVGEGVNRDDGDFTRGEPELPGGIDVAIHSAATVSFDPLSSQEAFQTNLLRGQNPLS